MTREEAIKYFENGINTNLRLKEKDKFATEIANENIEAYSMAISALSENKPFDGKTNGFVIISLYPDLKYTIQNGRVVTTIGIASSFDLDWWNAPYKAESEEEH